MALPGRVLARRAAGLRGPAAIPLWLALIVLEPLAASAAKPGPPAASRRAIDRELLRAKEQRVLALRAMLDRPGLPDRGQRLFRLAQLELELAVLGEAARAGGGDLEAAALTCRRLLLEEPGFAQRDEVRLFLARLELRRGRSQAALAILDEILATCSAPETRCQARLLSGEAWSASGRPDRAVSIYRDARKGCGVEQRQQARYRLGWALLAGRQPAEAASELQKLLGEPLPAWLRDRSLADLALFWSHAAPPGDAATFLLGRGGPATGGRLIAELAERLLEERRLEPLLRLTAALPATLDLARRQQLQALRFQALGRLAGPAELERELSRLKPDPGRLAGLGVAIARSRLELAARLESAGAAGRRRAEPLYAAVALGATPEAQLARLRLAELCRERGDLEGAARELEAALAIAGPRRAAASYLLLQLLEKLAAAAPAAARRAARERLVREAWRHARELPSAAETADVLLLLSAEELARGAPGPASSAAELFLAAFPSHPRREEGLRTALRALEQTARFQRAYELAVAEAVRSPAWRTTAARAALRRFRQLAGRGDLEGADAWIRRALDAGGERAIADEARLAAAQLRARQLRLAEAEQLSSSLADSQAPGRLPSLRWLAELREARGAFGRAAEAYRNAARLASSPAERLELLRRAGTVELAAGRPGSARSAAAAMLKELNGAPLAVAERTVWTLRASELLRGAGPAALNEQLRLAATLERDNPIAAARVLLRAARQASAAGRARGIIERALKLTGPVRRGAAGRLAARLELARARLERERLERLASPARRLLGLQQLLAGLLEVLRVGEGRLGADAALELTRLYAALSTTLRAGRPPRGLGAREQAEYAAALEQRASSLVARRRELLQQLARRARQPEGLQASTLEAARQLVPAGFAQLGADHLPASSPAVEPALSLLRAGRLEAAALASTRALSVVGERDDLLCVRGLSELARGRPGLGERDLQAALEANPHSRCARLNLGVLALWRGDTERAAEVLDGLAGPDRSLAALMKAGRAAPVAAAAASARRTGGDPEEPGVEGALGR